MFIILILYSTQNVIIITVNFFFPKLWEFSYLVFCQQHKARHNHVDGISDGSIMVKVGHLTSRETDRHALQCYIYHSIAPFITHSIAPRLTISSASYTQDKLVSQIQLCLSALRWRSWLMVIYYYISEVLLLKKNTFFICNSIEMRNGRLDLNWDNIMWTILLLYFLVPLKGHLKSYIERWLSECELTMFMIVRT